MGRRCEEGCTAVFEADFDVEDADHLALTLGNVDIAFDAEDLVNFGGDAVLLDGDAGEVLRKVFEGPVTGVLVDLERGVSGCRLRWDSCAGTNPMPCKPISVTS